MELRQRDGERRDVHRLHARFADYQEHDDGDGLHAERRKGERAARPVLRLRQHRLAQIRHARDRAAQGQRLVSDHRRRADGLHVRRIPEQHGHHGRRLGHGDDPHGLRQQPEEHTGAVSARNAVAAGARARPIQERHAGEGRLLRRDVVRGLCRYAPRLYDDPLPQLQQPLRHADPGGHLCDARADPADRLCHADPAGAVYHAQARRARRA